MTSVTETTRTDSLGNLYVLGSDGSYRPAPVPGRPMNLVDTCYGMTGGDLYVCELCGSRTVVRPYSERPRCLCTEKNK